MTDELLSLAVAVRAALEDAASRGEIEQEPGAVVPVPEAAPVATAAAQPTVLAAAKSEVSAGAGWSAIARSAREGEVPRPIALQRVREELGDCKRCTLCRERKQIVFGVGSAEAELVVVGEAPGYQEDQDGEPFVGPAGQMLDRMLENVLGLRRDAVYILNMVKCRPPKNRNPLPDELEACRPFLEGQLRALRPRVLLVLGAVAYRALFRTEAGISRNRGRWHEYDGIPALPTFHPAYLLRTPEDKKLAFEDLKVLKARLVELGIQSPAR